MYHKKDTCEKKAKKVKIIFTYDYHRLQGTGESLYRVVH